LTGPASRRLGVAHRPVDRLGSVGKPGLVGEASFARGFEDPIGAALSEWWIVPWDALRIDSVVLVEGLECRLPSGRKLKAIPGSRLDQLRGHEKPLDSESGCELHPHSFALQSVPLAVLSCRKVPVRMASLSGQAGYHLRQVPAYHPGVVALLRRTWVADWITSLIREIILLPPVGRR
jgi:hypothetical protein